MKTIQLKSVNEKVMIDGVERDITISTSDLIKTVCNNPVQGGFTPTEMIDRIRILDFLKIAEESKTKKGEGKVLNLEDKDYANLTSYVKQAKWGVLSNTVIEFVSQFPIDNQN